MSVTAPTTNWLRVSRRKPCPVCGRPDWCLLAADGSAAICARTAEGSVRRAGEAGWLHRLGDSAWTPPAVRSRTIEISSPANLGALAEKYQTAVHPAELRLFAASLGVTTDSLVRLRIGWDGSAWAFPMVDASGTVIGIRRRLPNGRKLSVRGGREGLFIPTDLGTPDCLMICEGPTDTASLITLGFSAIGRPSCAGGVKIITEMIQHMRPAEAIVVADHDAPGQRGAASLAAVLRLYSRTRVITPPMKDVRAWVNAGATAADITALIAAAPIGRLVIRSRSA